MCLWDSSFIVALFFRVFYHWIIFRLLLWIVVAATFKKFPTRSKYVNKDRFKFKVALLLNGFRKWQRRSLTQHSRSWQDWVPSYQKATFLAIIFVKWRQMTSNYCTYIHSPIPLYFRFVLAYASPKPSESTGKSDLGNKSKENSELTYEC